MHMQQGINNPSIVASPQGRAQAQELEDAALVVRERRANVEGVSHRSTRYTGSNTWERFAVREKLASRSARRIDRSGRRPPGPRLRWNQE